MESKRFSVIGAAFFCLLLIPVVYAASYLAMVKRETVSAMTANGCFTRHSLAYRAGYCPAIPTHPEIPGDSQRRR